MKQYSLLLSLIITCTSSYAQNNHLSTNDSLFNAIIRSKNKTALINPNTKKYGKIDTSAVKISNRQTYIDNMPVVKTNSSAIEKMPIAKAPNSIVYNMPVATRNTSISGIILQKPSTNNQTLSDSTNHTPIIKNP